MSASFDGAIIFELTNQKNNNGPLAIRPLGPFALHEVFVERDIPSTVINYVDFWNPEVLAMDILNWCKNNNIKKPLLLGSALFNNRTLDPRMTFGLAVNILKEHLDCTVILGGPNHGYAYDSRNGKTDCGKPLLKPDYIFIGRALHLFENWIDGDIAINFEDYDGLKAIKPLTSSVIEKPIISDLYDDYCLQSTDVLNFETRLGCKFNCTFCNFEFRNAKNIEDSSCEALASFFQKAKTEYGITNFSCVDDTFNEDEVKLDNLLNAIRYLDYQPKICGFTRFDLLMAKQHQLEKFDEIGFHGHFFGIETLHPDASKNIRKNTRKKQAYEFLKYIKEHYPHWYIISTYIIGLPGEPLEHAMEVMKHICKHKLVDAISINSLHLEEQTHGSEHASMMVKDPGKFGLEVTHKSDYSGGTEIFWKHEFADNKSADAFKLRARSYCRKNGLIDESCWDWLISEAVNGPGIEPQISHISNYINEKSSYLNN